MHSTYACKLLLDPSPATFISVLQKLNFGQCGKGYHILNVIVYREYEIKFLLMRATGEIGENFLLVKISTYMYTIVTGLLDAWHTQYFLL